MGATGSSSKRRQLVVEDTANSCFFRSAALEGQRKALIQITERCNLHCAHCFVSATRHGRDIPLELFETEVLARLKAARVTRLTLTGGEPFVHADLIQIVKAARGEGRRFDSCRELGCPRQPSGLRAERRSR